MSDNKENIQWVFYNKTLNKNGEEVFIRNPKWEVFLAYPESHRKAQVTISMDSKTNKYISSFFLKGDSPFGLNNIKMSYKTIESAMWITSFILKEKNIINKMPDMLGAIQDYYEYKKKGDANCNNLEEGLS